MKNVFTLLAVVGLTLTAPQTGQAFSTSSGMNVNPVNAVVFEAVSKTGSKGFEFWCAAGDYANRQLGASWNAKIYVVRGRGPSETTNRRSAVQFTLDPNAAGVSPTNGSISLNEMKVGENLSVQAAFGYCLVHSGRP